MRILHIINNLGSGGAEKLIEEILPLMNKIEEIETDLLILTDTKDVFLESLKDKNVKVNVVKYKNMYDPRNIFEIKKHIIGREYDIVHSHTFPTQMWVGLSKLFMKGKKVKFITTEHSTHNRRREKFYFRYIDKLIYSQYDSIISITEKTRDNLIDWIDSKCKNLDKHIVIENGVDIEKIKAALPYKKSELIEGISENIKLVCMVGRFSEAKDQPTLIRAISKLPEEVHLVLVGEGPLMTDNEKLTEELGISDRVHFLGFRQDIPRILKTVDIVVLSSHWEGFGLAAVEGMAAGKPVIASDVEGLRDVVDKAGLIFTPGEDKELSHKIASVLKEENIYIKYKMRSLNSASKYRIHEKVQKYVDLYKKESYGTKDGEDI